MPQTIEKNVSELQQRAINVIRALTIDATQEAGSGHPGMPMGAAPMGYVLFKEVMNFNPKNPQWANRDRYIQSAGHGSMLQYSLAHLTGFDLTMDDLKAYRQWESRTPGHPEHFLTPGVETTTGPLGQGLATAAGMALAEAHLAAIYNRDGHEIVDHYTYVIASDGDIMEGVTAESGSLAGHLGLGKLIVLYDDNHITLDDQADVSFSEDTMKRYEAYGWHTVRVEDGNDVAAIEEAVQNAKNETSKPSIISVRSIIGFGAPNENTSEVHGSPLGDDGAKEAKENLGIDWDPFTVPDDVKEHYLEAVERGEKAEQEWQARFDKYKEEFPDLAKQFEAVMAGELPDDLEQYLPKFETGEATATRKASNAALNALAKHIPQLLGGSADLAGSTKTDIDDTEVISRGNYAGRNIYFGVREHAMAAAANGMSLHGGCKPFVGTFLIFSDYLRPSLRLAALMDQPVIYVFTHDSIGLGGDGPTHQPIAQLMALRAIPHMNVIRPADGNEAAQAWAYAVGGEHPTALVFTRQDVPNLDVPQGSVKKGGYIISDSDGSPDVILIATGSEVHKCLEAKEQMSGVNVRVVSMPCFELFDAQDESYRESVLPSSVRARVAVEAGATLGWHKYVGLDGATVTLDRFGASADGDVVMEKLGFTPDNIAKVAQGLLS